MSWHCSGCWGDSGDETLPAESGLLQDSHAILGAVLRRQDYTQGREAEWPLKVGTRGWTED